MWQIFVLVLSLAAVSFGGGNTLMAGLEHALVQTGRIGADQFAFAVALGQSTPGPMAAFTTALGMALDGTGGAMAATGALIVVSLGAVLVIGRIPQAWFKLPPVRAALAAVAPFAASLALFMGIRMALGGTGPRVAEIGLAAIVAAGKLRRLPTPVLIAGAVAVGLFSGR